MLSFKEFLQNVIVENLHPELQSVVTSTNSNISKQTQLSKKIKDLTSRGESTGIEGNMPKGSSRAYLQHKDEHHTVIDGKPASFKTGTKVAITATLDKHHNKKAYDGKNLGQMQNEAEGGDHWANKNYRILTKHDDKNEYTTNKESGIFPPLVDHDHDHHNWTHVGHSRDIKGPEFKKLTKCKSHPEGISHKDFCESMERFHNRNNGKHWTQSEGREHQLDHIDSHPLVQKFQDYHGNTGAPPHDYRQIKNMGVFEHPDGSKHIVARDHGFNSDVQRAYQVANKNRNIHEFNRYR